MALREIRSNAPTPSTDKIVVASFNSERVRSASPCFQSKLERSGGLIHLIYDSAEDITDHDPANPTVWFCQCSDAPEPQSFPSTGRHMSRGEQDPNRNKAVKLESFSRIG